MADSLGIAAGTLAIVSQATKVADFLSSRPVRLIKGGKAQTIKYEIEIYTKILEEVGQLALSDTSTLPGSARLSLQLCQIHLKDIDEKTRRVFGSERLPMLMHEWKRSLGWDDMLEALNDYRRSVGILRDIVMDAITQDLLRRNPNEESARSYGRITVNNVIDTTQGTELVEKQIETFIQQLGTIFNQPGRVSSGRITINNTFTDRAAEKDGLSDDVLARLRKAAEGINIPSSASQNTPNPFQFDAQILRDQESNEENARVCAKLDTGSEDNWISASIVERLGMQGQVRPIQLDKVYTGAGGELFQPTGILSISWTRNSIKSWKTEFLVHNNAPFDLVLGRDFIVEEGLFVFADPVLVVEHTRLAPFTPDDYHRMEQRMRERGVENEELERTRDARAAAERQRKRAEKAASRMSFNASRMSLAATPGMVTPSSYRPTPSLRSSTASTNSEVANGAQDDNHTRGT